STPPEVAISASLRRRAGARARCEGRARRPSTSSRGRSAAAGAPAGVREDPRACAAPGVDDEDVSGGQADSALVDAGELQRPDRPTSLRTSAATECRAEGTGIAPEIV